MVIYAPVAYTSTHFLARRAWRSLFVSSAKVSMMESYNPKSILRSKLWVLLLMARGMRQGRIPEQGRSFALALQPTVPDSAHTAMHSVNLAWYTASTVLTNSLRRSSACRRIEGV